jgi:D-alanyl-D-alanine endopeptidase (penicillin-binding protein 7)
MRRDAIVEALQSAARGCPAARLRPTIGAGKFRAEGTMMGRRGLFMGALGALVLACGSGAVAASPQPAGGPDVRSAAALVVDVETGEVLFERQPKLVAPIASITKLMTALVVLDALQPLDEVVTLTADDRWKGKGQGSRLPIGAKITRADLLKLALMASENRAARVLARNYPGGMAAFVRTMNVKAKALGMTQSHFDDPSGLSNQNVSSARDLEKLINAVSRQSVISDYSTLHTHEVRIGKSMLMYRNTNLLVGKADWDILVQKTGYTVDAGECLVMKATIGERTVVMVLLNSFGKLTRTADARRIRRWMEAREPQVVAKEVGAR